MAKTKTVTVNMIALQLDIAVDKDTSSEKFEKVMEAIDTINKALQKLDGNPQILNGGISPADIDEQNWE